MDPKLPPKTAQEDDSETSDGTSETGTVNLQKRKADVEPTRYGDWELNGRCIDF